MSKSGSLSRSDNRVSSSSLPPQTLSRLSFCSQLATHYSPIVFPEKRTKKLQASFRCDKAPVANDQPDKSKCDEHRIDIREGDEKSDLLGYVVHSGRLILDKRKNVPANTNAADIEQNSATDVANQEAVAATLTSKALVWGSGVLSLEDVVSVSYNVGVRHFIVHSYPLKKGSYGLSCFIKSKRRRKDNRFVASSVEEAVRWVVGFADQQCFINCLSQTLVSSVEQGSETFPVDTPPELLVRCKNPPKMLGIEIPMESYQQVLTIHWFGLFLELEIRSPLQFLLLRLLESVFQGRGVVGTLSLKLIPPYPGGLTATDVFAVEWVQTGIIHFGMTCSYYGFASDVLELSEKYQKRFGPLRYFVAGFQKFLWLPKYNYEVEYLPAAKEDRGSKNSADREVVDMSDLYTDVMRRSNTDGIPRASSLSSIDSIMNPSRCLGGEMDTFGTTHVGTEPSDYVRGFDPKIKWPSSGRSNVAAEPEVIHPQLPHSTTLNWPRTRTKSRTDKGWSGLTAANDPSRCSRGNAAINDKEDISSTLSDPGPIWDAEPKWDAEVNWEVENPIELPGPSDDVESGGNKEAVPRLKDKWVVTEGPFLGILVCNHACRTVQSSQVVAPRAEHDDNTMDMLLVHGSGRLRLMRFFLLLQMGKHFSLPYVEYIKVSNRVSFGKLSNTELPDDAT
ncbi:Sphingoid long-chain bases kinase 1 [Hibiscus syriacus]|uniref:Sphingoid long-chain bases kinase 1 n=1 Tax=Hibiscus syriacus TaxID=106335 RepID=A0A6A3BYA3_HIBSY|nr:Sphingoid long-chain bases kinase 1 [Hibiscus syriacus]